MGGKLVCGILLTVIGLVYSAVCFARALWTPWTYNGIGGLLGSLLGTGVLCPFVLSLLVMGLGLGICVWCAFRP